MYFKGLSIALMVLLLVACGEKPEYVYEKTSFKNLPGWQQDRLDVLYPAFLKQCEFLKQNQYKLELDILNKPEKWQRLCEQAKTITPTAFKNFVEENFEPYRLKSRIPMLYTGYYKPLIEASYSKTAIYKYPLYAAPKDIIRADLQDFGIEEGGEIRGRVVNGELIPYHTRKEIDNGKIASSQVLLWAKSAVDVFFLQVQGSGTVVLPTSRRIHIAYADNNGHGYTSIGKVLIEQGELLKEEVSLFSIKKWLHENPNKAADLMQQNARYIFFRLVEKPSEGSLKMPLMAERSLAVDPKYIPLGSFVFVETQTTVDAKPLQKTFVAQDTGAAIRGPDRADIYFGDDNKAEEKAAYQNNKGILYLLAPRM